MPLPFQLASLLLAAAPFAAAHGGGMVYTIDGLNHTGAYPTVRNNATGSIQREWTWEPVDINKTEATCGKTGLPLKEGSYHASTTAGSTIHIDYDYWGHPFGPMLAYLAPCPSSGCETVDLTTPIWFKIWEAGLLSGTWPDGAWAMKEVFETGKLSIPIPASVKPGKYLLKHDMVNLQTGPLQFFVNCVQLEIKGEGTKVPAESELTAFPGGYDKDEGVSWPPKGQGAEWFYSVHKNDTVYPMPGPALWQG